MAERRMFTKKIVDSDAFLEMPLSTQALYFHLNMRADDDGFINNPKRIQKMVGASEDDLKLLFAKRFVLGFDSGVIVIKHWRMNNLLRKDRYNPTQYQEEFSKLELKQNGAYTESGNQLATNWQPTGTQLAPQTSIGKDSIGKDSIGQTNYTVTDHLSEEDWHKLEDNYEDVAMLIDFVDDSINDRSEMTEIRNPYKYIRQVAEATGWKKKEEGRHDI